MLKDKDGNEIKGYECKHVNYVKAVDGSNDDLLVIKEQIHYPDGTTKPNVRFIENFKRDFWITKEGFRTHIDKLEWEEVNRLQKFSSTQAGLTRSVARALGNPGLKGSLRTLARNPYLYGTDISTPVLAKRKYLDNFPECRSFNQVAVLDIETDVNEGTGDPISISLTFKDRAFIVATKQFIQTVPNPVEKTQELFERYLGKYKKERNIQLEAMVVDGPAEAIIETFKRAHEWMPDFIAIWNINYDLPIIISTLEKYGVDPAEVFSHPALPPKYRYAKYLEGASGRLTASGKYMPLHPADRWHTMDCPASFYFIDAMCVYKRVRIAQGNEASYSLDYILGKDLELGKLSFTETDNLTGLEWHRTMQKHYKIEYLVYNLFDCIGVELLDERNKDLASTISVLCSHSEYSRFPSQPRLTVDDLHFYCLENGLVAASTSDQMEDDNDEHVLEMTDWIVTLATHLVDDNGLKVINEMPDVSTNLRAHVLD